MKRTIRWEGKTIQVTRLYSSGVGEQFALEWKDASGTPTSLFLSEDLIKKNPQHQGLYDACQVAFGNPTVFNFLGPSA